MEKLIELIEKSYRLASNPDDAELAEEVSGECAEFLALWNEDFGTFANDDSMDKNLVALVETLKSIKGV